MNKTFLSLILNISCILVIQSLSPFDALTSDATKQALQQMDTILQSYLSPNESKQLQKETSNTTIQDDLLTHLQQLIQKGKKPFLCLDIGELLVLCTQPEYSRDITGRIYSIINDGKLITGDQKPDYNISKWWYNIAIEHNLFNDISPLAQSQISHNKAFTDYMTDFIYSTAAYLSPISSTCTLWNDTLQYLTSHGISIILHSTMHPHYQQVRQQMLQSSGFTINDMYRIIQILDKSQLHNYIPEDPHNIIIAIDDDTEKLKAIKGDRKNVHTIQYSAGNNITGLAKIKYRTTSAQSGILSLSSQILDQITNAANPADFVATITSEDDPNQYSNIFSADNAKFLEACEKYWAPIIRESIIGFTTFLTQPKSSKL